VVKVKWWGIENFEIMGSDLTRQNSSFSATEPKLLDQFYLARCKNLKVKHKAKYPSE